MTESSNLSEQRAMTVLIGAQTLAAGAVLPMMAGFIAPDVAEKPWGFGDWGVYLVAVAAVAGISMSVWGRQRYLRGESRAVRQPPVILPTAIASMPGVLAFTLAFLGQNGNRLSLVIGALAALVGGAILIAGVHSLHRRPKQTGPVRLG